MDLYVVVDCGRVVGISARQQGAELIRANEAKRLADDITRTGNHGHGTTHATYQRTAYDRMHIENHNLQDHE